MASDTCPHCGTERTYRGWRYCACGHDYTPHLPSPSLRRGEREGAAAEVPAVTRSSRRGESWFSLVKFIAIFVALLWGGMLIIDSPFALLPGLGFFPGDPAMDAATSLKWLRIWTAGFYVVYLSVIAYATIRRRPVAALLALVLLFALIVFEVLRLGAAFKGIK